jgi:uncharacterized membrane protein
MDFQEQERLERVRSRNEYGILAIKNLILLNGASAISMLTLIGAVTEKISPSGPIFGWYQFLPVLLFGLGAFSGAIAAGFANFSQQEHIDGNSTKGKRFFSASVIFVLIGYLVFLIGITFAFSAFSIF